eukprot:gnl/MRDRNA2_/MRDRNA2_99930_c0_seq1.p1 gnl/MRDRNA2_/MRDRNA2_99930_c0~~gnl/MRDRNA2_/MRDRNA2_99930_c0_seq1.p1  ORF type:complete len:385 (+),score=71.09 gnl/MRDRNA2_/MRDRNA2_99930_c0_seq1:101-1255(+)
MTLARPQHHRAVQDSAEPVLRPAFSQMLIEEYLEKAHHQKVGISRLLSCCVSEGNTCNDAKFALTNKASSSDVFGGIPGAVWLCGLVPMLDAAELSACRAGCKGLAKCVNDLAVAKALGDIARRRLVTAMCFGLRLEEGDQSKQNAKNLIQTALQSMSQVNAMELESLVESAPYAGSQCISAVLDLTEILLGEVSPSIPPGSMLVRDSSDILEKLCHFECETLEPSVILRLRRRLPGKSFHDWLEPKHDQPRALTALQLLIQGTLQLYASEAVLWESIAATAKISDSTVQELRQSVRHGHFIEHFCGLLKSPVRTRQIIKESKVRLPCGAPQKLRSRHNKRHQTDSSHVDNICARKPQSGHQPRSWGGQCDYYGRRRRNKQEWW